MVGILVTLQVAPLPTILVVLVLVGWVFSCLGVIVDLGVPGVLTTVFFLDNLCSCPRVSVGHTDATVVGYYDLL